MYHHFYRNYIKYLFKKLLKDVSIIPNISQGGCGITAYYLSLLLYKYNEPFEVVTFHNRGSEDIFKHNYKNREGSVGANHIMLSWNGYYVGSDGIFKQEDYEDNSLYRFYIRLTKEEFSYILVDDENIHNWNCDFKRHINEPVLIRTINYHIKNLIPT